MFLSGLMKSIYRAFIKSSVFFFVLFCFLSGHKSRSMHLYNSKVGSDAVGHFMRFIPHCWIFIGQVLAWFMPVIHHTTV